MPSVERVTRMNQRELIGLAATISHSRRMGTFCVQFLAVFTKRVE